MADPINLVLNEMKKKLSGPIYNGWFPAAARPWNIGQTYAETVSGLLPA
ncbi:hypothetical protein OYT88_15310 [Sporolactobacillus sp. CQH2019]|nr:hypothetical protein [Sporolactobacillus sp. CQH2019]MDD9149921.1 hypothetical protein [Sporolactobacillus sp. CQH2019]